MNYPNVSIVILNWNGWEDTIECLESLYKINYPNYDTIIVDNNSKNNSITKIREYTEGKIEVKSNFFNNSTNNKPIKLFELTRKESEKAGFNGELNKLPSNKKLILIKNENNDGFPGGCNVGMKYAMNKGTDYILLLNNDTVVAENFLSELVNFAETDPSIGVVGSKIYYYYEPNKLQAAGGKIRWYLGEISTYGMSEVDKGQYNQISERDYVYGTSLLLRKEVINKISYMDTSFFFGVEEYDYCTNAKKAGFKIFYVPSSKVWHKAGASSSKLSNHPDTLKIIKKTGGFNKYKYYFRIFKKHGPKNFYVFPFLIYMSTTTTIGGVLKLILKRDFEIISSGIKKRLK